MKLDQIVTKLLRVFGRKAARQIAGTGNRTPAPKGKPTLTNAQQDQARKLRTAAKTARKAAALTRRMGR